MSYFSVPFAIFTRQSEVYRIQSIHKVISGLIHRGLLLDESVQSKYPGAWKNSINVAKTHPIFMVSPTGDIIFVKESWAELQRFKVQQRLPGKAGFNPWLWRGYLQIPEKFRPFLQKPTRIKRFYREILQSPPELFVWPPAQPRRKKRKV